MKIEFKLYMKDVVDCSGGYINLIPTESTLTLLLDIIQKIVESEFVKTIGFFAVKFQENKGSSIELEPPYICDQYGFKNNNYQDYNINQQDMVKQTSEESRSNKIVNLYIESFESTRSRKSNQSIVPAGLTGIHEAFKRVKKSLSKIIFLSFNVDIEFMEGVLDMTRLMVDSRRNCITLRFYTDGMPLPEEAYENLPNPAFNYIMLNLQRIIQKHWPSLVSLDRGWDDDDLHIFKDILKSLDEKSKLNTKAYFFDSWYFPILKKVIKYDNKTDNVKAIYHPLDAMDELWIIADDLTNIPKIDTYGVSFYTVDTIDVTKLKKKELLFGAHISQENIG